MHLLSADFELETWKRYVDDTFTVVEKGKREHIIRTLNNFHQNIKFTHETEENNKIPFLDVLLKKEDDGTVQTTVYRKPTNNSIYIHWDAYAPQQWKVGTLFGIIRRAYVICSNDEELTKELQFITKVFTEINGYPRNLVTSILKNVKDKQNGTEEEIPTTEEDSNEESPDPKFLMIKVPYAGEKGETLIKTLHTTLKRNLPDNQEVRIVQTGTKLSKYFNIKDKVDAKHQSNVIYYRDCTNKKCRKGDYVGETSRRRTIRTGQHAGKDKQSWIFKHSSSTKHPKAKDCEFKILATNYPNRRKRRLAEAMFIRDLKPALNVQKESYKLSLFN